ncbi:hypothetical protein [uncultured Methanosphaera sp.]|uniref:hypothetical protein n=1 Tax=uncultured Methanosphaera sp. TaxID=262501 RepID=UPI000DC5E3A0|nr:hypothetical protein [uncultured Methanosphaera sp.]RAP45167.1 MAG: hypothetical protein BZ134_01555 [Methanosphaera sp. SHI1033]
MSFIDNMKEKIITSSNSYQFYKDNYKKLVSQNTDNKKLIKTLQKENKNLHRINEELKESDNQYKNIKEDINALSDKINDNFNIINQNNNELSENINKIKDNIRTNSLLIQDDIEVMTESSDKNNSELKNTITNLNDNFQGFSQGIESFDKNTSELKEVINNLNDSFNDFSQDIKSIDKSTSDLKDTITNLDGNFKEFSQDMTTKDNLAENDLNDRLDCINENVEDLEAKFRIFHSNIQESQNNLEQYKGTYNDILRRIREVNYGLVFNDTIKNSSWLHNENFSSNNGAANYSFLYLLYRILNEVKPSNILELGLGQSSKLTTQYTNKFTHSKLTIIDQDKTWIENFSKNLDFCKNISIKYVEVEEFEYNNTTNTRYRDLEEKLSDNKLDLVIIDGPTGFLPSGEFQSYPRSNILTLIDKLDDEFIIILDDYDRTGEQNTMKNLQEKLDEKGIEYTFKAFYGLKNQGIICTPKYDFITWF